MPAGELLDDVRALATEISRIASEILRMKKLAVNRVAEAETQLAADPPEGPLWTDGS